jgi:integrase
MSDQRVKVWVQRFKDRPALMLQWIDPETGARKSRSAKTSDPEAAETARADLEYELTHGKYQEASRMSWERFRELFEAEYVAGLRPQTRENYRKMMNVFEALCHPRKLRAVTERTVSAFLAGMRQKKVWRRTGMAPMTCKVYLQFLHTALTWAVGQKIIPQCPKFPSVKVPKKKPQPVPPESFERLLEKAPDATVRAYLLCGWLGGLRLSEAKELEWAESQQAPWLDLARKRIILPAEFVKATEDQWVPLDPVLQAALESLPRRGRKVFPFVGRCGQPVSVSTLSRRIVRLARKAGVRLSMHSLRKGFGCRFAGKVPAQVLQRLMRHADIKTTMAFYANVDQAVEEAILGPQRNSLRNIRPADGEVNGPAVNAECAESQEVTTEPWPTPPGP